jgi:DNA replication protein DnaC
MAKKHDELEKLLRGMFLATMAESFTELAVRASREGLSHEEFLYELARLEREGRDHNKTQRLLAASKLPREKTFDSLNVEHYPLATRKQIDALRSGAFLAGAVNVIAIGQPGTGKSHLTAALGHELVQRRHSVLWTPTFALVCV